MERPAEKTSEGLLVEHSPRLAEFESAFREENRLLFRERTRFLLQASLVFYPAFWLLDLIVARFVDRRNGPDLAEKVRAAVEVHDFRLDDGTLLKRTCSVGFAAYPLSPRRPRECSWQEIVGIADHGLYAAKRKGRNRWVGLEAGDTEDPLEAMQRFRESPESLLRIKV